MEENELRQDEVQENVVEENLEQEDVVEQEETAEEAPQEKAPIDWERRDYGAKSRDMALLGFFISPIISSVAQLVVKSQQSADVFAKIYIWFPFAFGLAGMILSIIGLAKSKSKWASVIGLLLNVIVIASSILLFIRYKMQQG